jgi:large repetitive protein
VIESMNFVCKLLLLKIKAIQQFLYHFMWLTLLCANFSIYSYAASLPPNAKDPLKTQAEVSFYGADHLLQKHILSNIVLVDVLPVPALTFNYSNEVSVRPGQSFSIPLALRNSGNTALSYKLALSGDLGDSVALVLDVNGNGSKDEGDIELDTRESFNLDYAAYDFLLLTGTVPSGSAAGLAYQVGVVAAVPGSDAIATANLTLNVSSGPQVQVLLEASDHILDLSNETTVTASIANSGEQALRMDKAVIIDGLPEAVTLLRYRIPNGMRYVSGSASQSSVELSALLFAKAGDPAFQYRTALAPEQVGEIAIAVRSSLAYQESRRMTFKLQLVSDIESQIVSQAEGFDDASLPAAASNILRFDMARNKTPDIVPHIVQHGADGGSGSSGIEIGVKNIGTAATKGAMSMRGELPFVLADGDVKGENWLCVTEHASSSGSVFQCTNLLPLPAGRDISPVMIDSARAGAAAANGEICGPDKKIIVTISVPNEAQGMTGNNTAEAPLLCAGGAIVSGRAWIDASNDGVYRNGEEVLVGWHAQLLSGGQVIKEAMTDPRGRYRISGIMPARGYSLRFLSPQGRIEAPPIDSKDSSGALVIDAIRDFVNGTLVYDELMSSREYPGQNLALLPTGIIFNKQTGQPIANAKVTLQGPGGFIPRLHLVGPESNVHTVTDEQGRYNFFLTPDAPAGLYRWQIDAKGFKTSQDGVALELQETADQSGPDEVLPAYKVFNTPAIPEMARKKVLYAAARSNGYFAMTRVQGAKRVVNNHLGLDPLLAGGELTLQKMADRKTVEIIDFFHYTLKVSHRRATAYAGFWIDDTLPRGLRYVPGSARLVADGSAVPDPALSGSDGGITQLRFDFAARPLLPNVPIEIRYRVAVGASVAEGAQLVSYATARAGADAAHASARIRISGGVFTNDAFVLGKVYLDCNGDGLQNADEPGVPGVRIYLEDGAFAETDRHGQYSLYGLKPLTHVLKMDALTLPSSARAQVLSNRHAGRGDLRFLDLRNGELGRGDFALSCSAAIKAEVAYRRAQRAAAGDELDSALKLRFDADVKTEERQQTIQGDRAGGWIGESAGKRAELATAAPPETPASAATSATSPAKTPTSTPQLESLLRGDTALRIVNLQPGQILSSDFTDVTVLGSNAGAFHLRVNGVAVPQQQVGQRSALASRHAAAWTYIAVRLRSGKNTLTVEQADAQGGAPHRRQVEVIVPGPAARIAIDVPPHLFADGKSVLALGIALFDRDGIPATAASLLSLHAERLTWITPDANAEARGLQVLVKDGKATVLLQAPGEAGSVNLRIEQGLLQQTIALPFEPALRPMVAAGIVEGMLTLNNGKIETGAGNNGFERELRSFSRGSADGKQSAAGRTAFFLKGQVKGDYLLTAAFDSDKDGRERLFRDIEPDKYYPVYGDDSVRGFDAQASSKLYLRIDKERSYLVYGDFNTGQSNPSRQLTQYSRAVNGIAHHLEQGPVVANVFASHDNLRQQVIQFRAENSRFYPGKLPSSLVEGSERVELVTLDRAQGGIGQKVQVLSRFTDYTIDDLSGSFTVVDAVTRIDPASGGENYYKITFEVEDGAAQSWLYGGDVAVHPTANSSIGVMAVNDDNPNQARRLQGVFGSWQPGPGTTIHGELAWTYLAEDVTRSPSSSASVMEGSGMGWRVGAKHSGERLQSELAIVNTSPGFSNLSAPVAGGRFEARAKGNYRLDAQTRIKAELLQTRDRRTNGGMRYDMALDQGGPPLNEREGEGEDGVRYTGALLGIERDLGGSVKAEIGTRIVRGAIDRAGSGNGTGQEEEAIDLLTLRARLGSAVPGVPKATMYGEVEQDVRQADKRALALGAEYALSDKARLYGRHEVISSLGSAYEIEEGARSYRTLFGIEGDYMEGGQAFSEYRGARPMTGRGAETAYGTRNSWQVNEKLNLRGSVERTRSLSGSASDSGNVRSGADATGISTVLEYRHSAQLKGATGLDVRVSDADTSYLYTLGVGYRWDENWTVLGKNALYVVRGKGQGAAGSGSGGRDLLRARQRVGLAYRESHGNRLNALGYYEHRTVRGGERGADNEMAHIVSLHANVQPLRHWEASGRYAAKYKTMDGRNGHDRIAGHLLSGRILHDLNRRWDIGVGAAVFADNMGQRKQAFGLEAGYQVKDDLWLSAGYNVVGFTDRDFAGMADTAQGVYFRLRYKFDENSF